MNNSYIKYLIKSLSTTNDDSGHEWPHSCYEVLDVDGLIELLPRLDGLEREVVRRVFLASMTSSVRWCNVSTITSSLPSTMHANSSSMF